MEKRSLNWIHVKQGTKWVWLGVVCMCVVAEMNRLLPLKMKLLFYFTEMWIVATFEISVLFLEKKIMYGFFKPNFPNKIVQHKVHLSLHIYFVQRFLKTNSSSEMPIPLSYKSTPQLSATHSASNGCTRWLKLFSNLMHFTLSCNLNKIYNCTLFFEIYSQQPKKLR